MKKGTKIGVAAAIGGVLVGTLTVHLWKNSSYPSLTCGTVYILTWLFISLTLEILTDDNKR